MSHGRGIRLFLVDGIPNGLLNARGARIEVIEAGNQLVRYRVNSHIKGT